MFDVVLFTDTAEFSTKTRGYGMHRLATHIRERGYSCIVIDFSSAIDYNLYKELLDLTVGPNTLVVGYSTTWMPFRMPGMPPQTMDPGRLSRRATDAQQFDQLENSKFKGTLVTAFGNGDADTWLEYPKTLNPKTKLILGGTKIDMYMDVDLADHFVIGYAETMMMDLLDSLSGKGKRRLFNRIIDHDQKAQAPVWDFRESKTTYQEYDFITSQEALSLEVGRGCRFKCSYCSYPLIGQKNTNDYLKYEHVLREELLENYNKWGVTRYYIMDDTFNDSTEKLQMFLNVTNSLPFKISFWCYLRLDLLAVHLEQIQMLKDMGMAQCYFGLETFHTQASKAIGKGMSAQRRKDTLKLCKDIWGDSVNIQSGFMVGLPHESSDSVKETTDYLIEKDCPIDIAWVFPLSIAGDHELTRYVYKSELDRNYEKYGYYFPNSEKFWEWYKDDDTDIDSFETAERVSNENAARIKNKPYRGNFYKASLNHPILSNRELTLSMTDEQYEDLLNSIDLSDLFYKTVIEDYFNPLLSFLKLKKQTL